MDNPFLILDERMARMENIHLNLLANSHIKGPDADSMRPITTQELCDHLGITEPTVLRLRKSEKFHSFV